MTLSPGTRLGPYEIVALLGGGGMGEVYRARDSRLGRTVAVKIVRGGTAEGSEAFQRFEAEAKTAGSLNHPNILAIYDVGRHELGPYLVSELLEGESLADRLAHGPLPPQKALDHATQIASGLAAAHARGIVHRDLKPGNLFVTKEGRVKILDFGLAKLTEPVEANEVWSKTPTTPALTGAGLVVGTVIYMSPEQVRGETLDHRSDVFSFGAVFYEMLTGRRAFDRGSNFEAMIAILREEPAEIAETTAAKLPGAALIVRHCLEKNPDDRFQSTRDLVFHLTALAGGAGSAIRSQPLLPVRPDLKRRAWRAPALLLVALATGGAAFLAGQFFGRPPVPAYRQMTFRQGLVQSARFAPDGHTIVYGAAWDGKPLQLYSTRPEGPESRALGLPDGDILSISSTGEMAISIGRRYLVALATRGTLARVPLDGGAPREILAEVDDADWAPDGQSLAVVRAVQDRYRLEFPIGNVLYETEGHISHPRVSLDGRLIAFIDHPVAGDDRGAICVIDRDRRRTVLSAEWASANGLAWSPKGDEIWFTASDVGPNCALYAVTLSGKQRLITRSPGRLIVLDVHRDGRVLMSEGRTRTRITYRGWGEAHERDLSWLDFSVSSDLSSDASTLLFNEQRIGGGSVPYALYIRKTDGAPAIRLGEGFVAALSPDGKWAAAIVPTARPSLTLLPTGAGEPRTLDRGGISNYHAVSWLPDGQRILFSGNETGSGVKLYVQDVRGGKPRAISGEGIRTMRYTNPVAPDGRHVAAVDRRDRVLLQAVDGGEPQPTQPAQPIRGLDSGDIPIRWSADGQSLYVFRRGELPGSVFRLQLARQRKELVAELLPSDLAGVRGIIAAQTTPDGRSFVYSYSQVLSDLYLVEHVR